MKLAENNRWAELQTESQILLKKMMNSKGPKIVPSVTPDFMVYECKGKKPH